MDTIRHYIINNFYESDFNILKSAIEESIKEKNDLNLPGLGVFFELVWQYSSQETKNEIIKTLKYATKKELDN